jgi:hypothetical protein
MNHITEHILEFLKTHDQQLYWKFMLINQWSEIMGPLAHNVSIEKMYKQTIVLGVNDSSWMQELHLLSNLIKDKINKALQTHTIENIKFRYAPTSTFKVKKLKKEPVQIPAREYVLTDKEQKTLQKITDPELAQALQGFLQKCHQFF